jgi:hypothetical protein
MWLTYPVRERFVVAWFLRNWPNSAWIGHPFANFSKKSYSFQICDKCVRQNKSEYTCAHTLSMTESNILWSCTVIVLPSSRYLPAYSRAICYLIISKCNGTENLKQPNSHCSIVCHQAIPSLLEGYTPSEGIFLRNQEVSWSVVLCLDYAQSGFASEPWHSL